MSKAAFSTARHNFSDDGFDENISNFQLTTSFKIYLWLTMLCLVCLSGKMMERVFADYAIYKGKASLSASPVLPQFAKLDVRLCTFYNI